MYTAKIHRKNNFWPEDAPPPLTKGALCLSSIKHNGKSGTGNFSLQECIYPQRNIFIDAFYFIGVHRIYCCYRDIDYIIVY